MAFKRTASPHHRGPTEPAPPPPLGALPHPLTFFLTADERTAVLGALRKRGAHRSRALCKALGVAPAEGQARE